MRQQERHRALDSDGNRIQDPRCRHPDGSHPQNSQQLPSKATTFSSTFRNFATPAASSSRWGLRYPNGNKMIDSSTASKATNQHSFGQNEMRSETLKIRAR